MAEMTETVHEAFQTSSRPGDSPLWSRARCQGHSPLISTSIDQLRHVRTSTISPSTPTVAKVGSTAMLWMISANQEFQPDHEGSPEVETQMTIRQRAITYTDKGNKGSYECQSRTGGENPDSC